MLFQAIPFGTPIVAWDVTNVVDEGDIDIDKDSRAMRERFVVILSHSEADTSSEEEIGSQHSQ